MNPRSVRWACAWLLCAATVVGARSLEGSVGDPAFVTGAAVDTCFDCKDMDCSFCARPSPCRARLGYCQETVRNLSQYCQPKPNGQWEQCKWRVEQGAFCVTELLNPCTTENPVCTTVINGCGPLGICIPEGPCVP